MLYPWSRSAPPRAPCALDRWIGPGWRLLEFHAVEISAPPAVALEALARLRLREMPAVRALFALRGLDSSPERTLKEFFSATPFVLLEDGETEFVGGVVFPGPGAAGDGLALARAPFAAIATFRADPGGRGATLWTETWVRTRGPLATGAFAAYWLAIGPFSAWIRRMFLREARRRAERPDAGRETAHRAGLRPKGGERPGPP